MDLYLLCVVMSGPIRTASALYECTGWHTAMGFLKVGVYNRSLQQECCVWFEAFAAMWVGSALFGDFMQRRMVVSCRRFGTTHQSQLEGSNSSLTIWPLKMGPIGCPETSVRNYQLLLRKILKGLKSCSKSIEDKKVCTLVPTELVFMCYIFVYVPG